MNYLDRLRALREDHDLTQKEMAQYLYCSQQTYSRYELGKSALPIEVLVQLADYFQMSVDSILGRTVKIK